jgi:osmotically-inducible protein OsmY
MTTLEMPEIGASALTQSALIPSESADRDLERRILNYLAGRHVSALRQLEVEAHNGTVTLRGRVKSFYEKQLCQHCCRRVAGVVNFIDDVQVSHFSPASVA